MTHRTPNQDVPNALPSGYRFNELEIKDVMGGGDFSIVYRAWDHQLERLVAIKEFVPAALAVRGDNNELVLRSQRCSKTFTTELNHFIQEARLLAQFTHPNLLQVLRFWIENDTAYMATVFYSGMTLTHLKNHTPEQINESWIRQMLPLLLDAIKTLHDNGYLHCDIALDNIQIQENGQPVLLDFGSARRINSNATDETEAMLRPGYTPIELYTDDNEDEKGPWTDIYALGAVLYTLITGTTPPVSVMRRLEDRYEPLSKLCPPGYSPSLLEAIDRALALEPQARPLSVEAFAELLARPVEEAPQAKTPEPPPLPGVPLNVIRKRSLSSALRHFVYRRPATVAIGVIAGLVLGGMLIRGMMSEPEAASASNMSSSPVANTALNQDEQEIALFYFQLNQGDQLMINDTPYARTAGPDGILTVRLKAGQYTFAVKQSGTISGRSVNVTHPGTWFIIP